MKWLILQSWVNFLPVDNAPNPPPALSPHQKNALGGLALINGPVYKQKLILILILFYN